MKNILLTSNEKFKKHKKQNKTNKKQKTNGCPLSEVLEVSEAAIVTEVTIYMYFRNDGVVPAVPTTGASRLIRETDTKQNSLQLTQFWIKQSD